MGKSVNLSINVQAGQWACMLVVETAERSKIDPLNTRAFGFMSEWPERTQLNSPITQCSVQVEASERAQTKHHKPKPLRYNYNVSFFLTD